MLEVVEEVEVPEEGGGGTSAGSLPGRPAFPACEATAAEEGGGGGGRRQNQ